tara:strand:+ start:155 stop:499 length:345 start_codon:yes stop_codon:yes gene_type:complete
MIYLKEIMRLLNCDMEKAEKVFDKMELDFSQSTTAQFNREVIRVNQSMKLPHDPDYGDNTNCDCCGDVFDARNSHNLVIKDKWICDPCTDLDDDKIADRLGMSEAEVSEVTTNY